MGVEVVTVSFCRRLWALASILSLLVLASPLPASAYEMTGHTYTGTHAQSGSVQFIVNEYHEGSYDGVYVGSFTIYFPVGHPCYYSKGTGMFLITDHAFGEARSYIDVFGSFDAGGTASGTFNVHWADVGCVTGDVAWTATVVNQAPVLDPIGSQTVMETETLSFDADATDADADPLTYSAAGPSGEALPTGATFDTATGQFSWTPGLMEAGTLTVRVTVSDGVAADHEDVLITVERAPSARIRLRARPRIVEKGRRVRLIARTRACGCGPDPLVLLRNGKRLRKKWSTGDPVVFRVRMRRTETFRVRMPTMLAHQHYGGASPRVRVGVTGA